VRRRKTSGWLSVRSLVTPGVLRSGKLNCFDLAHKTQRLFCAGNLKLHIELRWAFGILVDCKQGPLLVRSSHSGVPTISPAMRECESRRCFAHLSWWDFSSVGRTRGESGYNWTALRFLPDKLFSTKYRGSYSVSGTQVSFAVPREPRRRIYAARRRPTFLKNLRTAAQLKSTDFVLKNERRKT
jgi:hypothetical protein